MAKHDKKFIGISPNEEMPNKRDLVDVRTSAEKFNMWMSEGDGPVFVLCIILCTMFFFPIVMEPLFLVGMGVFFWIGKKRYHLPFRMPKTSNAIDYNDIIPGPDEKYNKADGIVFLGNEMHSNKELWVNASDSGTHFLIFGTTGSGKAIRDDAQVRTPCGWQEARSLKVGDLVTLPSGNSSPIVDIFPQGELDLYEMEFADGRIVEVSGDHLWGVQRWRKSSPLLPRDEQPTKVMSTLEIRSAISSGKFPLGSEGIAIPLSDATDNINAEWENNIEEYAARVLHFIVHGGVNSGVCEADTGSLDARAWLFEKVTAQLRKAKRLKAIGRATRVPRASSTEAQQWLVTLGRSLGLWAKSDPAYGVTFLKDERQSKIVAVKKVGHQAKCRCLKIDSPDGLFIMDNYVVTHNTEALISLAYNALVQGSGLIYVDGKGDNSLFAKIFSMVRRVGRDDDILAVNYMTGGRDVVGPQEDKLSNTMNPFISGTAGSLTQLVVSLMPSSSGGDGDMWQGRAIAFLGSVMMALCHLRDQGEFQLGVGKIREYMVLDKVEELNNRKDLTPRIHESLESYLHSLAGYVEGAPPGGQSETALEQHGFLQMQFTRTLGSLADDYGYIFSTTRGEVDFHDIVLNNRVLAVLLPALEKSPEELGNLGKIIVASLKSMMATGLGDKIEGDTAQTVDAKPTSAPSPFLVILDEYGYYVVKGAAVAPAQARSINFSMCFAGQDYPSFKKGGNKEEAEATVANCNVVCFMKLMDTADTGDLFAKLAGKAKVVKAGNFEKGDGFTGSYRASKTANVSEQDRGAPEDLRAQLQGEAHIIFKRSMVRARMFYAAPKTPKSMRLNHLVRVEPPTAKEMAMLNESDSRFKSLFDDKERLKEYEAEHELQSTLAVPVKVLEEALASSSDPVSASVVALAASVDVPKVSAKRFSEAARKMLGEDPDDDMYATVWDESDEEESEEYESEDDSEEDSAEVEAETGDEGEGAGSESMFAMSEPKRRRAVQEGNVGAEGEGDNEVGGLTDISAPQKGKQSNSTDKATTVERMKEIEVALGSDNESATEASINTAEAIEHNTRYPEHESVPKNVDEETFDAFLSDLEEYFEATQNDTETDHA